MYTEFYDLIAKPFELTPDPRYVYLSVHHKEALAHLKYGVDERKGFIQLTGEVGTGKTTMLDVLVSELDASTAVAKLTHTTIDDVDLLRMIARGFGIGGSPDSKADLLDLLRERLTEWSKEGRNAVLVVDEAQNLSLPVLEEIRLLSNLKANGRLGLQIILAGQPELREKLENPELRQLRQRIGIRYHLTPLSRTETAEYIEHRMAVAGSEGGVFTSGAIDAVYEHSQGVPRIVNMVCDRALLAGYAESKRAITRELVASAIEGLEGKPMVIRADKPRPDTTQEETAGFEKPKRSVRVRWAAPIAAGVVLVAVVLSAVFYFESKETGTLRAGEEAVAAGTLSGEPLLEPRAAGDEAPGAIDMDATETSQDAAGAVDTETSETPDVETGPVDAYVSPGEAGVAENEYAEAPAEAMPPPEEPVAEGAGAYDGEGASTWVTDRRLLDDERPPLESAYLVVAASGRDSAAAARKADELTAGGVGATVWTVDLGESGVWHRVVLKTGYDSLPAARRAAEALQGMGYEDAWVLRR